MKSLAAIVEAVGVLMAAMLLSVGLLLTGWAALSVVGGAQGAEPFQLPMIGSDGAVAPTPSFVGAILSIQVVVFGGIGMLMMAWRTRSPEKGSLSLASSVAVGLVWGVGALFVTFVLAASMRALGFDVTEQDWVVSMARANPDSLLLLSPWIVLAAPWAEEVFFRGYLFRFLNQRIGYATAYALSALLFGIIHFHVTLLPVYFFYGLWFAFLYRITSRLAAPVAAHATVNSAALLALWATGGNPPV